MGRATQGVRLIRLDKNDSIADIAVVPYDPDADQENPENEEENQLPTDASSEEE